jgi:excinuclease ABC subunit C
MTPNSDITSPGFDFSSFLAHCSSKPGVYRMYDIKGRILYVGKARNLRARLKSYFQKTVSSLKTGALVARIARIDTLITASEVEALLLEQTLIKELAPPYNILLRDDKSYPYIKVSVDADFPRATLHRGSRGGKARYFGPYPGAGSAREVLNLMEKAFQLRNCSDSFFRNRTRPCLQYQIHRCTAPCVGFVSKEVYRQQVEQAIAFLEGRDDGLIATLKEGMEQAAARLDFEKAAQLRDRLSAIQEVRQQQYVDTGHGNLDAVALAMNHGEVVVSLLMIRQGRVLGNRNIFPRVHVGDTAADILAAFLEQHYLGTSRAGANTPIDRVTEILLDRPVEDVGLLQEALHVAQGHAVRLAWRLRGERQGFVRLASVNAGNALQQKLSDSANLDRRFTSLEALVGCDAPINRIECFDISHTSGKQAVASCVVALREVGMVPRQYRKFNVAPASEGDDYAALYEAVGRRLRRVTAEGAPLPDVLLIDGGKGQIARIRQLLEELGMPETLLLLGISKGPDRRAGQEVLHYADGRQLAPADDDPGLHLLQQVRDEAHRFAITSHRARRAGNITHSRLEDVPGIGPVRRRELLHHFGGLRGLRNASMEALCQVPGINENLADEIYRHLHGD